MDVNIKVNGLIFSIHGIHTIFYGEASAEVDELVVNIAFSLVQVLVVVAMLVFMDEDEGQRLWFRVGGLPRVNGAAILGDGDNVTLHTVRRQTVAFIAETGGGDMTDHNNRRAWIARTRRNNLRFRLILLASVGLAFSLFVAILSGMAIRRNIAKAKSTSHKMEIYGAIDRGYISSRYIHVMNEALYLIRYKRESDLLRKIRQLNDVYTELLENIREVMKTITEKDDDDDDKLDADIW